MEMALLQKFGAITNVIYHHTRTFIKKVHVHDNGNKYLKTKNCLMFVI